MNPSNYPYNSSNPQLPPQPPRKSKAWIAWALGGAGFVMLLVFAVIAAKKLGSGFGKLIHKGIENQAAMEDSFFTDNLEKYDKIYAMLGKDNFSVEIKAKLDSMRNGSHEIYAMLNAMRDSFADTVKAVNPGFLDREISRVFFIRSGRAALIQKKIFDFYMSGFNNAPAELQIDPLLSDNLQQQQGDLSPNSISYRNWADFKFNKPWQAARVTIRELKFEVRDYEADLLTKYEALVEKELSKRRDTVR